MVFKLLGYFLYFSLFAVAVVAVIAAAAFFISCAMTHDTPGYALKLLFGKVD